MMKTKQLVTYTFLSISIMMFSGCVLVSSLLDPVIEEPNAWKPEVPTETAPGFRPLKDGDPVDITIRVGSNAPMHVTDIIDGNGEVTLPFLGRFRLSQYSTAEAAQMIKEAYIKGQYFRSADVTVLSTSLLSSSQIFVTGAISRRGNIPYTDGMTLLQAILIAGDTTPFASSTVVLRRNGVNTKYNTKKIKSGRIADPPLMPNDMIDVHESWF